MTCCGIDIHAHVVPGHFPAWLDRQIPQGWPAMVEAPARAGHCHRHVMIDGKNYRTVTDHCWNVARRLADLPEMGIATQVISPMPELLSYWLPAGTAQPLVRFLNETIAAMVAESNGVLQGFGAVPLQDMNLALAELDYLHSHLHLSGVEIGSHINGIPLGDMRLRPFFEACAERDIPVFVHALKPTGMDRLVGPAQLQQVLAYPSDVGLAATSVITGNLLESLPALRLAFSHGGGTFASLLPRLQQGWLVFPDLQESIQTAPVTQARQLYFDTLVFDPHTLQHLIQQFGASQLMLGTDYPFNFREKHPAQQVLACQLNDADRDALLSGNAARFLGFASQQTRIST
ncbi:aminocarboxymuconate-semialdehyde decarboxylase [Pokkaliibacter plantistimulans]|uniref:Aminocarboxymuconate-semialdehyde decarboxylase n=1 Tax=Pokkaliibacter plantistimulans TaxID=1635171 RepID=A0ABX5LR20_9GAMM|nr:amidohydrolase family protein [Pokkaliibacter plantistimulans]PXF29109.1 aminocarboxymuconate-semialdehyde decarboxylase [Pokkaliibacter plantistimulans]